MHPFATLNDLKDIIEGAEGTPADQQRLIFGVGQLEGHSSLFDYNIRNLSTLTLAPWVRKDKNKISKT